ncbi:hypothetical protein QP519_04570 [Weeksella virosa]|uniref:hypothetical protein n=1 Tax=Weeksella virosa TaxID=1014 RepID=UPI002555CB4E|nr:hypothetical protein [Weeksella virosa]MDK7374812.1 hypothetical protein [Weeksella virosa]
MKSKKILRKTATIIQQQYTKLFVYNRDEKRRDFTKLTQSINLKLLFVSENLK